LVKVPDTFILYSLFHQYISFRDIRDGSRCTFLVGERCFRTGDGAIWIGYSTTGFLKRYYDSTAVSGATGLGWYISMNNTNNDWDRKMEFRGFSSEHAGGAHFCFADGHTHFIAETINPDTYISLSLIKDGGPIEGFSI